jgi:hypothetical protein
MWLINTSTITLERANPDDLSSKPYAILSHTWGTEEVTFEDMINQSQDKGTLGYTKIENTCRLAKERGLAYAWVDTCCIDKRSSAELAEAINSMFRWYKQAIVCFAYLEDLPPAAERTDIDKSGFELCRWFTRGWTLQELIGPKDLEFYDCTWQSRGTKASLGYLVSHITSINLEVLNDGSILESIPIANRMSWAAGRKTTRIEDMAYCLLGIFDVNMPMMYGEGTKAFERLQEEIIKQTTDMSIFAWKAKDESQDFRGILAQSPDEFGHCGHLRRAPSMRYGFETSMTNKGLRLNTFLANDDTLDLACLLPNTLKEERRIGVFLTKTADGYVRSFPTQLFETVDSLLWAGARYKIFVRKRVTPFVSEKLKKDLEMNLAVRFDICPGFRIHTFAAKPADLWDQHCRAFITNNNEKFTGFLDFQISDTSGSFVSNRIIVACGHSIRDTQPLNGYADRWTAIHDSRGGPDSKAVMDCVNGYYESYGEEFFLHQLGRTILAGARNWPREINMPSDNKRRRLVISSEVLIGLENRADSIIITVASR